jgi:hypothetical protein
MTIKQAFELPRLAKSLGYALAVKGGKVQFQIVTYKPNGTSSIQEVTDWLSDYDEAASLLNQ